MLHRHLITAVVLLGVACADSAANDDVTTTEPVAPAAAAATTPAAATPAATPAANSAGSVRGRVQFKGEVPARAAVDLSPDPYCHEAHADGLSDQIGVTVGKENGLADVFVQLTGVPDEKYETPETPVVLDQVGCTYVPHVFGVMTKQDIEIRNSDATLHNVHPTPDRNKEFNLAMPNKGDVQERNFRKAEDGIPFKCDVHPWMRAFCFVMEHPYFGVSDADGNLAIDTAGLPDGEYGFKAWHETLGEKEGKVKVEGGAATIDMTFGG